MKDTGVGLRRQLVPLARVLVTQAVAVRLTGANPTSRAVNVICRSSSIVKSSASTMRSISRETVVAEQVRLSVLTVTGIPWSKYFRMG